MLFASILAPKIPDLPRDATRTAIVRQFISEGGGVVGCAAAEISDAVTHARIKRIGTLAGDPVVLAALSGPCLSGAANGPWLVCRVSRTAKRALLATIAQNVDVIASNDTLPRLRESMHGSAYESKVTIDVFRAGHYVAIDSYMTQNGTREWDPRTVDVTFTPGESSARLSGKLGPYWGRSYAFRAVRGQRLMVDRLSGNGEIWMYFSPTADTQAAIQPGVSQTLARSGVYRMWVYSSRGRGVRYAFTLTIR